MLQQITVALLLTAESTGLSCFSWFAIQMFVAIEDELSILSRNLMEYSGIAPSFSQTKAAISSANAWHSDNL
jgi:hypothetical protein